MAISTQKASNGREIVVFPKEDDKWVDFEDSESEESVEQVTYLKAKLKDISKLGEKEHRELLESWFDFLPELQDVSVNDPKSSKVTHRNLRSVSTFIMNICQFICIIRFWYLVNL